MQAVERTWALFRRRRTSWRRASPWGGCGPSGLLPCYTSLPRLLSGPQAKTIQWPHPSLPTNQPHSLFGSCLRKPSPTRSEVQDPSLHMLRAGFFSHRALPPVCKCTRLLMFIPLTPASPHKTVSSRSARTLPPSADYRSPSIQHKTQQSRYWIHIHYKKEKNTRIRLIRVIFTPFPSQHLKMWSRPALSTEFNNDS